MKNNKIKYEITENEIKEIRQLAALEDELEINMILDNIIKRGVENARRYS